MKLKFTLLGCFMLFFYLLSFSQNTNLQRAWVLQSIDLSGFQSEENAFEKEASFFAYFLDNNQRFDLSKNEVEMLVGGDQHNYQVRIENQEIVFEYENLVYVKKDNKVETFTSIGATKFKFELQEDVLILQRKNENFVERYTFVSAL